MATLFGTALRRAWRQHRALLADERAATAVEFGLLALPFFSIIAAILQTSVIFLAGQVLHSAVYDAARTIRTGQVQTDGSTLEQFRTDVCGRLHGLFDDCAGLHVRVVEVTDFQSARVVVPVEPDCVAPCDWTEEERWTPGAGKSVMLVQVYYRYPVLVPLWPLGMSNLGDGRRLLGSATVFQNEPF